MIKVVVVDDHKIVRDGIRALLANEPAMEVVEEAANGKELISVLEQSRPDVALVDLNMPVMDGVATTEYIRQHYPELKVLVLTMLDYENYLSRLLKAGASGYLLKNTDKEELIYAIRATAKGKPYICTEISIELLKFAEQNFNKGINYRPEGTVGFSKREMEVLELIAQGFTNAEIADKLFTSRRTIETHRQHLLDKTQSKNTAALISFSYKNNIL